VWCFVTFSMFRLLPPLKGLWNGLIKKKKVTVEWIAYRPRILKGKQSYLMGSGRPTDSFWELRFILNCYLTLRRCCYGTGINGTVPFYYAVNIKLDNNTFFFFLWKLLQSKGRGNSLVTNLTVPKS
jgi:hypothetical protein